MSLTTDLVPNPRMIQLAAPMGSLTTPQLNVMCPSWQLDIYNSNVMTKLCIKLNYFGINNYNIIATMPQYRSHYDNTMVTWPARSRAPVVFIPFIYLYRSVFSMVSQFISSHADCRTHPLSSTSVLALRLLAIMPIHHGWLFSRRVMYCPGIAESAAKEGLYMASREQPLQYRPSGRWKAVKLRRLQPIQSATSLSTISTLCTFCDDLLALLPSFLGDG